MLRVPHQCWLFILLLCMSTSAWAATIEATVTRISDKGLELTLKDASQQPNPGDPVDISFPIPGGDRISIGEWRVDSVDGKTVSVSVVRHTGKPMLGYLATIQTSDKRRSAAAEIPPAAPKTPSVQNEPQARNQPPVQNEPLAQKPTQKNKKSHTPPQARAQVSAKEQQLIEQLRSSDPAEKRKAVLTIHRSYLHNTTLQDAVEDELLKAYKLRSRDKRYIDALAWMCIVLGDSGNPKFAATLKQVYRESKNRKVRKYAKANYRKVR